MTTLADIARIAGVSPSTVSRALADSPLVNRDTKERIKRLASETGFRINQVARSLAKQTSQTIGLVVPGTLDLYFPMLIDQIVNHARTAGYSLLLNISGSDQQEEGRCLRSLYERRVDGIILTSGLDGLVAREEACLLLRRGVPLVVLGWVDGADEMDMVACDDAAGGYDLTRHLISLGHRHIVFLGPKECRRQFDRIRGFRQALKEAALPTENSLCLDVYTERDVRETVRDLFRRPTPPTALFAFNDTFAIWTLSAVADAGIRVPEQVAVVGFGNSDISAHLTPRLTTVGYPVETIGEKAVSLLLKRTHGEIEDPQPRRVMLTPRLVVRQSCGAALRTASEGGESRRKSL